MGLERFIVGRFGTTPQIDLDKQIARVRLSRPVTLDFQDFADAIVRNNMGVGGFRVYAAATIEGGRIVFRGSDQSFPITGDPPSDGGPTWFRVEGWKKGATVTLSAEEGR